LGGALVHSARGTDEEGAAALHEGTTLAEELGRNNIAATGWREISWVQFLRAQYERAEESLTRTAVLAGASPEELAWVDVTRGACRHDIGDHAAAGELLRSGVERATQLPSGQPLAQALTMLGRYHLLRGELEDALHHLDQALAEVEARGMTASVSWPEAFRGDLDLILGDLDTAQARFEHEPISGELHEAPVVLVLDERDRLCAAPSRHRRSGGRSPGGVLLARESSGGRKASRAHAEDERGDSSVRDRFRGWPGDSCVVQIASAVSLSNPKRSSRAGLSICAASDRAASSAPGSPSRAR
jgi:tetratricopeptide (TPR) repeat protein